jgi:hypothetical protein
MNWEAIGAIGEVVGAAAVVITLVFLILQLRQNTVALSQQSERQSTSAMQQAAVALMHPAVSEVVSKAYDGSDPELTAAEMALLEQFAIAHLLVYQQDYSDAQRGLQDGDLWEARMLTIRGVLVSPFVRRWWRTVGHAYFTASFQAVVEEILAEPAPHGGDYWKRVIDEHRRECDVEGAAEGSADGAGRGFP